jgi:hypothetical protein
MRSLGMPPIVLIFYAPSSTEMIGRYVADEADCADDAQKDLMVCVRDWTKQRVDKYMGLHQDYFAKDDIRNLKKYGFGKDFTI